MKCQIIFSGKNKKNITNFSSAELAKRVVKVKKYLITFFLISLNICFGYSLGAANESLQYTFYILF